MWRLLRWPLRYAAHQIAVVTYEPRWIPRDNAPIWYRFRYYGARADHTARPDLNAWHNNRIRTNEHVIPNGDLRVSIAASILVTIEPANPVMINKGDVRTNRYPFADLDKPRLTTKAVGQYPAVWSNLDAKSAGVPSAPQEPIHQLIVN